MEDFEKYDDLMTWEFAQQGRDYWNKKLERVKECFINSLMKFSNIIFIREGQNLIRKEK